MQHLWQPLVSGILVVRANLLRRENSRCDHIPKKSQKQGSASNFTAAAVKENAALCVCGRSFKLVVTSSLGIII